jgi:hypothetical protein
MIKIDNMRQLYHLIDGLNYGQFTICTYLKGDDTCDNYTEWHTFELNHDKIRGQIKKLFINNPFNLKQYAVDICDSNMHLIASSIYTGNERYSMKS